MTIKWTCQAKKGQDKMSYFTLKGTLKQRGKFQLTKS